MSSNNRKVLNKNQNNVLTKQKQTKDKTTTSKQVININKKKENNNEPINVYGVYNDKYKNKDIVNNEKIENNSSESDKSSNSESSDSESSELNNTKKDKECDTTQKIQKENFVSNIKHTVEVETQKQLNTTNIIKFSIQSKNYSFLSNYYCVDIVIDNEKYYHVEGYYQSRKFVGINNNIAKQIQFIRDPIIANKRGNSYLINNERKDMWDKQLRDRVMKQAVYTKFITNSELSRKLLDTNDCILIENNPNNTYWGVDKEQKGENMLGKILMEVRDILNRNI